MVAHTAIQHTQLIIDIVFIPVYAVLAAGSIYNVIKHGANKTAGFLHLALFSVIRVAAFALATYNYYHPYPEESISLVVAAFILQGLGYSFLLSSSIAFISRLWDLTHNRAAVLAGEQTPRAKITRILYLVNTAALVLLIIGYSNSQDVFNGTGTSLNSLAKIGDCIFCGLTAVCIVLTISLFGAARTLDGRAIIIRVIPALIFMAVREAYVTYRVFESNPLVTTDSTVYLKLVLQYILEVLVVAIYLSLGFAVSSAKNPAMQYDYEKPAYEMAPSRPSHQGQQGYY